MALSVRAVEAQNSGGDGTGPIENRSPADEVNPFIGSTTHSKIRRDSDGKTFPGAATPYGLVQLSPDTVTGGDNGSGYNFEDTTIQGFSFTHMSGVGAYGDLGNFMVMPTTGELKTSYGETDKPGSGYLSRKADEIAQAGYYAVTLSDYGIRTELTAAPHSGMLRFTFPKSDKSRIQIDLARRVGGTSVRQSVKVVGEHTIEGWMLCTPDGGGWMNGNGHPNYTVYFHAEFSQPIKDCGVWSMEIPDSAGRRHTLPELDRGFLQKMAAAKVIPGCREMEDKHLGFYIEFPTKEGEQVLLKSGISFVSIEGARKNLAAEIPDWDFDRVRQAAHDQWNKEISRITVEGGTPCQRTAFYTAMYHSMLDPRAFADLDGAYPGGDRHNHTTDKYTRRTIFSGWDVYRSDFPLMTIIAPDVVNDMINSLTDLAIESKHGTLERWEFLNACSGCMNGNPAVNVIADAYAKGIRNYDIQKVYGVALNTCEKIGPGDNGYDAGQLSSTLEYDFADWNLAQIANDLGKVDVAKRFLARSRGYRHLFNAKTGWFEGSCVESNTRQQGWFVPHDVPGLIELAGGKEKFTARLNDLFEKTPDMKLWNDYYNQSNEPVHLIPFLFNRAGAPWLTQKWVRFVCENAYGCDTYGICGNDDVGQMSAWYVLASAGIHQACPGDTRYELFTPLFDKVEIHMDPKYNAGKTFTIISHNNGTGPRYIQSATLNGKPLKRCWLDYKEIVAGGTLVLELATTPNKSWGNAN